MGQISRSFLLALHVMAVLALSVSAATAQTRHALVIGIDDYTHVAPLQKARNDAQAVAATLDAVGFETDLLLDADQLEMATGLARLSNRITPGDEVVFFFAGHGIEVDGRNYLLPADVPMANPGQEIVLLSRSMEVATILDTLRAQGARISLLILDACRDNPFPQQGTRSLGGRRGLARVAAPEGTFVMFSAGDGQAALDRLSDEDPDPNSVFTRVLLPRLAQPGMPIHQLARDVRTEVRQLARRVDHEQFPAVYDQFDGDFALVPAGMAPPPVAPPMPAPEPAITHSHCDRARDDWGLISGLDEASVIEAFIAQYDSCGLMKAIAQARLAGLTSSSAAAERDMAPPPLLRPWCGASSLNVTEGAICASPILAGLDEQLEHAFQSQNHVSAAEQRQWLGARNACGSEATCISQQMTTRIAYLSTPPAPVAPQPTAPRVVQGTYQLPESACYVTTASRGSIAEAEAFIRARFAGRSSVRVFQSNNGWYGITLETTRRAEADSRLAQLKGQGVIPGDSYCSSGANFVAEVHLPGLTSATAQAVPQGSACWATVVGLRPRSWGGNDSFLAMRVEPTTQATKISELYLDDQVTVLERRSGWARVRCQSGGCLNPSNGRSGAVGWSSLRYLSLRCDRE